MFHLNSFTDLGGVTDTKGISPPMLMNAKNPFWYGKPKFDVNDFWIFHSKHGIFAVLQI